MIDRDPKIVQLAITRTASKAGLPTAEHNLHPRTRPIPAEKLKVGDVLMASNGHPALIVRVRRSNGRLWLTCRYVWQSDAEAPWPLGPLLPGEMASKAVRRGTR